MDLRGSRVLVTRFIETVSRQGGVRGALSGGTENSRSATASRVPLRTVFVTTLGRTSGHVGDRSAGDWVGGEDVLGAVGPFAREADARGSSHTCSARSTSAARRLTCVHQDRRL